jgi:OOP family OmpA-OmpF porin
MPNFRHALLPLLVLLVTGYSLSAQDDYKRWALEINGGTTVPNMDMNEELQYFGQGGVRFNISKLFGIKADYAQGILKGQGFNSDVTIENEYYRYGIRGTVDLGQIVKLNSETFSFLLNAGVGNVHTNIPYSSTFISDQSRVNYKGVDQQEDYESDDIYTNFGGRVQIRINERFAANVGADFYSTRTDLMDGLSPDNQSNKYDDSYVAAGAGLSFYFGSGEEHADWAPVSSSPEMKQKTDSNRKALDKLNGKFKDSDGDGVLDAVDVDNSTKDGIRVNAKGEAMDTDYDGIVDYEDECPVQKGPDSLNGCPPDQEVTDSLVEKLRAEVRRGAKRPSADQQEGGQDGKAGRRNGQAQEDDGSRDRQARRGRRDADSRDKDSRGDQSGDRRSRSDERGKGEAEDQTQADKQGSQAKRYDNKNVDNYPVVTVSSKGAGEISTYYIIGGSFSEKPNAIDFNEFLKSEGFDSKILFVEDRGLFRVAYNSFDGRENATNRLSEIRSQFNDQAWILGN